MYVQNKGIWKFVGDVLPATIPKLPPSVYAVDIDPEGNIIYRYLYKNYDIPNVIYGDRHERDTHIAREEYSRSKDIMSVLLSGTKGTGKSLTAETILNDFMLTRQAPVLMIRSRYHKSVFYSILKQVGECAIYIDEYTDLYNSDGDDNDSSLSLKTVLTEGRSKALFLLTTNDRFKVDDAYMDRPNRVLLHYQYDKLDKETIKDIAKKQGCEKYQDIVDYYCIAEGYPLPTITVDTVVKFCELLKRYADSINGPLDIYGLAKYIEPYNIPGWRTYIPQFQYTSLDGHKSDNMPLLRGDLEFNNGDFSKYTLTIFDDKSDSKFTIEDAQDISDNGRPIELKSGKIIIMKLTRMPQDVTDEDSVTLRHYVTIPHRQPNAVKNMAKNLRKPPPDWSKCYD